MNIRRNISGRLGRLGRTSCYSLDFDNTHIINEDKHVELRRWHTLSGHEHPYSIKMSHLRDVKMTSQDDAVLPLDIDTNHKALQCQFILRQTKKAPTKISHGQY